MDEELAYNLCKAMYENVETLNGACAVMEQFGVGLVLQPDELIGDLQYHPGSLRYFQEQGWIK